MIPIKKKAKAKKPRAAFGPRNQDPKRMTKKNKEKMARLKKVKLMPEDILDKEQMEMFEKATGNQQVWLIEFLQCGNAKKAAEIAYPNAKHSTQFIIAHKNRLKFHISVADLYRAAGITEAECITATKQLLNAEKITKTFIKGDLQHSETVEDTHAIDRGLNHAEKMLDIDPGQKLKLGEDKDNPMSSLAGAILAANKRKDDKREAGSGEGQPDKKAK